MSHHYMVIGKSNAMQHSLVKAGKVNEEYWRTGSCKLVIRQVATFSTASKHKIA